MSHVSLYRRWRPKTFEEIIGQERITRTLQNAIRSRRTSHAYLFAGHRGTGKTTTARIFAKALNCKRGPTPTPCNECPACESISRGVSMDVIEIDGASNTSVDDVRDLKEKIVLVPTEARYKVYIVDEVHMLSVSAFNALLKTLEEPPAHAVFILVTTEPHRIPPTVLSRCQRFDFRRVSFAEITGRLRTIAHQERMRIDDAALAQIVRSADGSVRDAESVLDQLSAYADGTIDRDLVIGVLGLVDDDTAAAFADATLARDVASTLRLAQDATDAGKDSRQLLRTLLEYFRDLLMVKTCGPDAAEILDAPKERFARLAAQVEGPTIADLLRAVRVLNDAVSDARWSTQPRLALEVALIRLARPEMDPSVEGMLARIERLEAGAVAEARGGGMPSAPPPSSRPTPARRPRERADDNEATASAAGDPGRAEVARPVHADAASPADRSTLSEPPAPSGLVSIDEVRRQWARVLEDIKRTKMLCHALLIEGTPLEVNGNTLVVGLRSAYTFHADNLNRPENREIVEAALARVLAHPLRFQCRLYDAPAGPASPPAGGIGTPDGLPVAGGAAPASPGESMRGAPSLIDRARELFGAEIIEERPAG